jgi:hypothetical protein
MTIHHKSRQPTLRPAPAAKSISSDRHPEANLAARWTKLHNEKSLISTGSAGRFRRLVPGDNRIHEGQDATPQELQMAQTVR